MPRTFFGFYELDASPQRGLPGELATRLGSVTETPGFIDGSIYVRSDNLGIAIVLQHDDVEGWTETGNAAVLLQAADWRSRSCELASYELARHVEGDGDDVKDSTFYIVQHFDMAPSDQAAFVDAICAYAESYAQPIPGFLAGDAYASVDPGHVVFVMPWAHEAALGSLENRDGSLAAMQKHLRLTTRHVFGSYQRISYLRASAHAPR